MSDGRTVVPEPEVKEALRDLGLAVPRGVTGEDLPDASELRAPLVLKAFGPGIVHKTELGGVDVGVDHAGLDGAAARMRARLAQHGIRPAGFLVEEQADTTCGIELLFGVVRREPFGLVAALGIGGTLAETLDLVSLRLVPLDEHDAHELVAGFPGSAALSGARGARPVDREALVQLVLALAGRDGLASRLGDELAELECNPVLVTQSGATVLDARLVLRPLPTPRSGTEPATDFTRLFAPRAVAVAGASSSRSTFGNRALAAYRAFGWAEGLYALHPDAAEIDGVPARPRVDDIDTSIDYLLVAVPAARCAEVVRALPRGQVPFVHVISGGFDEVGADGAALSTDLVAAAREVRTRVLGPNCIGVYSPTGRQVFQLNAPRDAGTVSIVSQSGGLSGDIISGGARRGIRFSKVVSVGNAVDVTPAELLDWLVDDTDTGIIGLYLEGAAGAPRLVEAFRRARGRKPVVLLVGGQSPQGAEAVLSHTGALTGERRVWEAIARSTGVTLVRTLEEFLAVLAHLQRWSGVGTAGHGVLVVGVGGGASVLATDACDRAGLTLTPTTARVRGLMREMGYGAGTSVANPLEIPFGPAVPVDALRTVLVPLLREQTYADVLVHVNVSAYYGYGTEGVTPLIAQLADLAAAPLGDARLGVVLRNLDAAPGADRDALVASATDAGLVTFSTLDEGGIAVAAVAR